MSVYEIICAASELDDYYRYLNLMYQRSTFYSYEPTEYKPQKITEKLGPVALIKRWVHERRQKHKFLARLKEHEKDLYKGRL